MDIPFLYKTWTFYSSPILEKEKGKDLFASHSAKRWTYVQISRGFRPAHRDRGMGSRVVWLFWRWFSQSRASLKRSPVQPWKARGTAAGPDVKDTTLSQHHIWSDKSFWGWWQWVWFCLCHFPFKGNPKQAGPFGLLSCRENYMGSGVFHTSLPHPSPITYYLRPLHLIFLTYEFLITFPCRTGRIGCNVCKASGTRPGLEQVCIWRKVLISTFMANIWTPCFYSSPPIFLRILIRQMPF